MKKVNFTILSTLILLSNSLPSLAETNPETNPEKELLGSAIKIYNSISTNEDIKTRISKQELTLKKLDKIIDLYAGTDIGLELITTGETKGLNIENIRKRYLSELLDYSLRTCKSEPSFSCLGFISLQNGSRY